MSAITKFELEKILKNKLILGGIIASFVVLLGSFFMGYISSQSKDSEMDNARSGFSQNIDEIIEEKYQGDFTNEKVNVILRDAIENFQSNKQVEKQAPFYLFYWQISDTFFIQGAPAVYGELSEAIDNDSGVSLQNIPTYSIDEIGFRQFNNSLKIGNFVPWTDFYEVTGYVFLILAILVTLICATIFSEDTVKNINQLLYTTQYGRNELIKGKIKAAFIFSLSLFVIYHMINFIVFSFIYDISGWKSSIQTNFGMKLFQFPVEWNHMQIYLFIL
ncbi:ABC transporter permease [Tetragenococcus halophilus]|uniref:Uncharacterized protein n=2 Tax=Tetragenococcus halophilus TaxID=51669 RepID=A0A2H6CPX0_TETHA|nr:ABC transporter permease [Tetragenococcus halophilus]MDN6279078.1 ABC transporter permease [Lactococcus lactis]MDN6541188.1 ABC transporter permease [Tetragenococcus koreensis]AYW50078.1 ABC transporter permease [Tetragenococcus halophilus]MCF1602134.1 ABC transporter permease [Tetragenococcus halophilus]MCO7026771.1 ABC transporter permease [Tetragenococcus halophilus]